jgi:hypothetical protein
MSLLRPARPAAAAPRRRRWGHAGRLLSVSLPALLLMAAAPAATQVGTPETVRIEVGDVARFLEALDSLRFAATGEDSAAVLLQRYYEPASPGLLDFVRLRIGGANNLLAKIAARPAYYAHLPTSLARVQEAEPAIRDAFRRFEALHPEAVFTDVYLVVGRMNSGGTTSRDRILIGAEMYGRDAEAPTHELNGWERAVLGDAGMLDGIVVHELMHINQPWQEGASPTLLQQALREGGADFVAELVTGKNINAHVHAWADPREAELWEEFRASMGGTDYSGWLYSTPAEGRPADLAYWMGYRIARAYYEGAEDKRRAIADILASPLDAETFLRRSGYAGVPGQ